MSADPQKRRPVFTPTTDLRLVLDRAAVLDQKLVGKEEGPFTTAIKKLAIEWGAAIIVFEEERDE